MIDIADRVAIYHRFLTEESIFLRDDIGAERLFTCTVGQHSSFELLDYGYGADNFWYDITMWNTWVPEEFPEEDAALLDAFVEEQKALAYAAVEEYRQLALQNPDKFYIFFTRPAANPITYSHYEEDHWAYTCAHAVEVTDSRTLYEMPLELFEEKYLDLLIKAYRYDYFVLSGGARLDDQGEDGAVITDETLAGLYNFRTGEEYTDIMQVFNVKKFFLQSLLEARVVDQLMNRWDYQYTRRQAEAAVRNMEYRLFGQSIIITIDGLPGFEARENLHSFDPAYLTIYE